MKLEPNSGSAGVYGYNIEGLAPTGQAIAICLDIRDQMGVERKKFQSEEIEKADVTRFLFGFLAADGKPYLVQTFEFTISGNSGSNLVSFLKAWTNRDPYGYDYLELKGTGAMITVGVKESGRTKGKWYNTIAAVSPVYPTLQAQIPQAATFAALLQKALTQPEPGQSSPPSPASAPHGAPSGPPAATPPPGLPLPTPPQSPKFWVVGSPGAAAVEATRDQLQAAVNAGRLGIVACPMDNPQAGWQDPAAFGIVKFSPPPVSQPPLPGMPPLPAQNPQWQQPPAASQPPPQQAPPPWTPPAVQPAGAGFDDIPF